MSRTRKVCGEPYVASPTLRLVSPQYLVNSLVRFEVMGPLVLWIPSPLWGQIVMASFPRTRPASRCLIASGTSATG